MTYIRRNPLYAYKDLSNMAKILIPKSPKDSGTSNFFTDNARKLFVGLGLYLVETESERDLTDYRQRTTLTNLFKLKAKNECLRWQERDVVPNYSILPKDSLVSKGWHGGKFGKIAWNNVKSHKE